MKLLFLLLSTLLLEGNQQYAAGHYDQAVLTYQQVLDENPSGKVYYNLGNAYFKQGELSQAILAWERALRLCPNDKDIKHNLHFAESQIVDRIEDHSSFFLSSALKTVRNQLSESTWTTIAFLLFIITLIAAMLFAFSSSLPLRKTAFYIGILTLILTLSSLANAASIHHRDTVREEAIITQGIVNVKSSPDRSGTDLFTLHEGTKVVISETLGDWCCVHVGGNVGWMRLSHLERI